MLEMKTLLLLFLLCSCLPSQPDQVADKQQWVKQMAKTIELKYQELSFISPSEVLKNPSAFQLLDARGVEERAISTLPKAQASTDQLSDNPNTHWVVYCTIGERSAQAAQSLLKRGFKNVSVLSGGVLAWAHAGGEFVDSKASPTRQVHIFSKAWDFLPEDFYAITP